MRLKRGTSALSWYDLDRLDRCKGASVEWETICILEYPEASGPLVVEQELIVAEPYLSAMDNRPAIHGAIRSLLASVVCTGPRREYRW